MFKHENVSGMWRPPTSEINLFELIVMVYNHYLNTLFD